MYISLSHAVVVRDANEIDYYKRICVANFNNIFFKLMITFQIVIKIFLVWHIWIFLINSKVHIILQKDLHTIYLIFTNTSPIKQADTITFFYLNIKSNLSHKVEERYVKSTGKTTSSISNQFICEGRSSVVSLITSLSRIANIFRESYRLLIFNHVSVRLVQITMLLGYQYKILIFECTLD